MSKSATSKSATSKSAITVFTVGYEGRSVDDFVSLLRARRIDRVIDVRALPLSRRRGFSKTKLSEALAGAGIEYVHLRIAGNPYRNQRANVKQCLALYRGHLERSPEVIASVLEATHGYRAALLCVERDACNCHRSVLASKLAQQAHVEIADL
jgi:uncharacterized protein (DUF488 family)